MRARMASETAMPASAPALASNPAQNAAPMTALNPGAIGKRKPIMMQAKQVRIRKRALAPTLTAPRLAPAVRRLAYQSRAKAAIAAAIRMDASPVFAPSLADRCVAPGAPAGRRNDDPEEEMPVQVAAGVPPDEAARSLSCVFVSKSLASWRSCNWLEGSPEVRLTIRPRLTAGRTAIVSAQRRTFL